MNVKDELDKINLVDFISKYLRVDPKNKDDKSTWFYSWEEKTASLQVWNNNDRWYRDDSWKIWWKWWWDIVHFLKHYQYAWDWKKAQFEICKMYWIKWEKKEFKKSPKRFELAENFLDYKLWWTNQAFIKWLNIRWIKYDFVIENKELVSEMAKELWYCESTWISGFNKEAIYKDVLIFPCYDEEKKLVWVKLRRTDWIPFVFKWNSIKSTSIWKPKDYTWNFAFSTWLLFDKLDDDYVIITEWEADYVILKLLWFKSIIWNLGWVSANFDKIQKLTRKTKKIISFYDNDIAWIKANRDLVETIWRPIRRIVYPKIEWKDKFDVNDLFNMWYWKKDFASLIDNSEILDLETAKKETENIQEVELYKDRFFYNNTKMEYFDTKDFNFASWYTLARHLFLKPKELEELRSSELIPTYEWICYFDWWKKDFYNLLDKSRMIHPSKTPTCHPLIRDLIANLCNHNKENILWLLEAIIYKYTHLNDVLIPAVVFHGVWWTWKGLFTRLLEQIFGENNTLSWLSQDNLESKFSTYSGQKLIVEFQELSVWNTASWKKNMQKLKTFIMAEKIMIEKKWKDPVSTENLAWFLMSSNEAKPIQLDSSDSGNRRFTIMRTWKPTWLKKWWQIRKALDSKQNIENFLAWLLEKFPNIHQKENILPLDNEDKRDLEDLSESFSNSFFKWFEEKYPNISFVTVHERNILLDTYSIVMWDKNTHTDDRYKIQYFNSGLSIRYKITSLRINWKTERGYLIDKKVTWCGHFSEWYIVDEKQEKIKKIPVK